MKINRRKRMIVLSILLCVILAVWTVWGNTALMVNTVAISSSRIPVAFSGFRIAQESVKIAQIYYVTGNHEAANPQYDTLKAGIEAAGVIVLEDETVYLERRGTIVLLGLADPKLKNLIDDEGGYTISLSHRPELFESFGGA